MTGLTPLTEAQRQLVEDNIGLAYFAANKYIKVIGDSSYEDIVSMCYEGLIKAVKGFDAKKGFRLSTYVLQSIKYTIYSEVYPQKLQVMPMYLESIIDESGKSGWEELITTSTEKDMNDLLDFSILQNQMLDFLDRVCSTERQKDILKFKCKNPELTLMQVAEAFDCSKQNVSNFTIYAKEHFKPLWDAI